MLQMADDVLMDMIERSGIDLSKLEPLISQQAEDTQKYPGHHRAHPFTPSFLLIYPYCSARAKEEHGVVSTYADDARTIHFLQPTT